MKKNNLFKILGIVLAGYVLLSWLVPIVVSIFGWKVEASYQIGLTKFGSTFIDAFAGFSNVIVFILLIGGLYAVMDATGAYKPAIEKLAEKFKGKEKLVLITIIVLMAIISSITGLELGLLILFPFIISLVLMMGYDKIIALVATFGATIVGMYGATYAGTLYGYLDGFMQTKPTDNILAKVILFVLALGLLIGFTLIYMKKNNMLPEKTANKAKKSKEKAAKKTVKSETKKEKVKKADKKEKEKKVWPLLLVLGLLFLVLILGTTAWGNIFSSNWFATAHDTIMNKWKIGGFKVVEKLFGGLDAFGTWTSSTRYVSYSIMILFAVATLAIVYKVKLKDAFDAFVKGIKEYVVPAFLALIAYSIFVFTIYYPVLGVITTWITGLTDSFNIVTSGLHAIISSVFYPDFSYYGYYIVYTFVQTIKDTSLYSLIGLVFTNLYALVMLVAPTSVLLLTSLSISEVKYTEWLKFIWKYALCLLVVSFIVFTVLTLI
mgnify:CR=1 FL=1